MLPSSIFVVMVLCDLRPHKDISQDLPLAIFTDRDADGI
jgi:hypothetical protein